jgi:hypothetical protein
MRFLTLLLSLAACSDFADIGDGGSRPPIEWQTRHTVFSARILDIDAGENTFRATVDDTFVNEGYLGEQTTLEASWREHDVEMRLFIYLETDGVEWWAHRIAHYNGAEPGDWVEYDGDFFRTPAGTPFVGDLDLETLRLRGASMTTFLPPLCTKAMTIEPAALAVELWTDVPGEIVYRLPARLRDGNCEEIAAAPGSQFHWSIDDSTIATVAPSTQPGFATVGEFHAVSVGTTTASVTLTDVDGVELANERIPVVVDPTYP